MEVRSRAPWRLWTALLGLSMLACTQTELPRTEIVVAVDTDLALGEDIDQLRIEATGPDDQQRSASVALDARAKLPQTLGLVHEGGALGPFRVVAVGLRGGQEILRREAELSFIADKTLSLPLHLVHSCKTRACNPEQTCSELGCVAANVDATRLAEWRGRPPTLTEPDPLPDPPEDEVDDLDAGSKEPDAESLDTGVGEPATQDGSMSGEPGSDAGGADGGISDAGAPAQDAGSTDAGGMCVPKVEACNQLDDDCDGLVDNGYDLMTDTRHCGVCNKLCSQPTAICCKGVCSRNCAR